MKDATRVSTRLNPCSPALESSVGRVAFLSRKLPTHRYLQVVPRKVQLLILPAEVIVTAA